MRGWSRLVCKLVGGVRGKRPNPSSSCSWDLSAPTAFTGEAQKAFRRGFTFSSFPRCRVLHSYYFFDCHVWCDGRRFLSGPICFAMGSPSQDCRCRSEQISRSTLFKRRVKRTDRVKLVAVLPQRSPRDVPSFALKCATFTRYEPMLEALVEKNTKNLRPTRQGPQDFLLARITPENKKSVNPV